MRGEWSAVLDCPWLSACAEANSGIRVKRGTCLAGLPQTQEAYSGGARGHRSPWGKDAPNTSMVLGCHQLFTQGIEPGLEGGKLKGAHSCLGEEGYAMRDYLRRR